MERQNAQREREALHREREQRDAAQRQELQAARDVWNQSQQPQPGDAKRTLAPAQTRYMTELQDRKIDELREMMSAFTIEVKGTFAEIAHAQKGNEIGFNQFRAELKDLTGGMIQVVTKTQELESAVEEWTEPDGLEAWTEEEQQDSESGKAGYGDDVGAPDGAAKGKVSKKTKLVDDPEVEEQEEEQEDEDWQGEDEYEEYETSEEEEPPGLESGSDDDISVPGCTEDDKEKRETAKKVKLLKTSKQRDEQRSKSQPPRTRGKEADTIALNSFPDAPGFMAWWNNLCTIVSASSRP